MARSSARDAFLGSLMFLLLLGWLASYLYHDPDAADVPIPSNHEESQLSPPPVCGDSSWSAGSAFYTIAALCFGYYAYPRGSLIAASSGRTWRLSPILVLEELILWLSLFVSAGRKGKPFAVTCHALLACRLRNGFNPSTIVKDLDLTVSRPSGDITVDKRKIVKALEAARAEAQARRARDLEVARSQYATGSGTATITVPASSHDAESVGSAHTVGLGSIREGQQLSSAWTTTDFGSWLDDRKRADEIISDRHRRYDSEVFTQMLERLRESDSGPSYRLFVWAPMLLQLVKLVSVAVSSKQVSWMVYAVASIYFSAWLVLETSMLQASQRALSAGESESALELCLEWRPTMLDLSAEHDFDRSAFDQLPAAFHVPSLFIGTAANIVLTAKFVWDSGVPKFESFALAYFVTLCIFLGTVIFVTLCTKPVPLLAIDALFRGFWHLTRAERLFGKLEARPEGDLAGFYSASIALHGAVLAIMALVGVGGWKDSFRCWEMNKPQIYDWLG